MSGSPTPAYTRSQKGVIHVKIQMRKMTWDPTMFRNEQCLVVTWSLQ